MSRSATHLAPHEMPPSLALDTDARAEKVQFEIYRRMTPLQKVEIVQQMNQTVRHLAMIGLRDRHPDATEEELLYRYVAMVHGEDLARRAYGDVLSASDEQEPR